MAKTRKGKKITTKDKGIYGSIVAGSAGAGYGLSKLSLRKQTAKAAAKMARDRRKVSWLIRTGDPVSKLDYRNMIRQNKIGTGYGLNKRGGPGIGYRLLGETRLRHVNPKDSSSTYNALKRKPRLAAAVGAGAGLAAVAASIYQRKKK
jgi:hypothetical protein